MIEFEHVSKTYDKATDRETKAVRDISLKIGKGEFVFIVGNSGSGKTTLIKLLLKEIEATSGNIRVGDTDITKMKRKMIPRYRRRLGVVFQDFRLLKDRNVYENVAFAQRVVVTPTREIRKRVPEVLAMVGLSSKYKSLPSQLSGGEQQRVAIARALVNRPEILLADEPTGNMDPGNAWQIMKLLEEINEMGTTVVVVTHSKEIVDKMKKRVITMKHGVIVTDKEESGYGNEN
ncbi:cell division ATP-binding protein FtsE [Fusibacillus kribbianus]|uniref:Cell division ATP-binding protein FtsE n=1 Tax=Fusibacillus kribbianus TaxID=3044208 RepID=A0AAP4BE80_9FIRM|nr:cell division ATP-binding protein FtsE [Ruminococcus sp. YH-rum2234]MDI9242869.1 cell division ATP-binding protein FtsE [Ruminococcus sp. YH-rum2234]